MAHFGNLFSDLSQVEPACHGINLGDHAKLWDDVTIGEVTGEYTPLHTVPVKPVTRNLEQDVCAASAARQRFPN